MIQYEVFLLITQLNCGKNTVPISFAVNGFLPNTPNTGLFQNITVTGVLPGMDAQEETDRPTLSTFPQKQ